MVRHGLNHSAPGGQRTEPRIPPIRNGEHRIVHRQRRHLGLVSLQLMERRPDRGVPVGRIRQLDNRQRHAVYEHHDVGPPRVPVLGHGELVDGRPGVGVRLIKVDGAHLDAAYRTVGGAVLHRHAVHQQAMEGAVARLQRGSFRLRQLAQRVVERISRKVGIEARERGPEGTAEQHVRMTRA